MRLGYDLHGKRFRHFQNNYSSSELSYYLRDFFFFKSERSARSQLVSLTYFHLSRIQN